MSSHPSLYSIFSPTYVFSTIGYTTVVFVVGTLGWWGPAAIEHAFAAKEDLNETSQLEKTKKDRSVEDSCF